MSISQYSARKKKEETNARKKRKKYLLHLHFCPSFSSQEILSFKESEMEIRKGKLKNTEAKRLIENGCFIREYKVNGEDYTYIIRPAERRGEE